MLVQFSLLGKKKKLYSKHKAQRLTSQKHLGMCNAATDFPDLLIRATSVDLLGRSSFVGCFSLPDRVSSPGKALLTIHHQI